MPRRGRRDGRDARPPRPARVAGDRGRARDGVSLPHPDRLLRVTLAAGVAALLFFSISIAAELFFVKDVLAAGDAAYGALVQFPPAPRDGTAETEVSAPAL